MRKPILIALAGGLWLLDVLATDIIRGTIVWVVFGGAGFFIGCIGRMPQWPR